MNIRNLSVYAIIVAVAIAFMMAMQSSMSAQNIEEWSYTDVRQGAVSGEIIEATVENDRIVGETKDGKQFYAKLLETDFEFAAWLADQGVDVNAKPASSGFNFGSLIMLLFFGMIGFFIYMQYRQMNGSGGGRGAMNFGKSRARLLTDKHGRVTFADVAGVDEAKEELQEVVEFLQDPSKFQRLGGKIPKGALLVGPPGTGKTLIARAVAGEANVPFFTISGSDFVEMFVGVGASRVRDMFEKAKQNAPCIIFIDEIDAVGRSRGAGMGGGNDEREQTLNQLLVEMDGFETNEGIILIAATNRPDVLDPALLRPGRFDRQVTVGNPDVTGREKILMVHMRNVPTSTDVNPKVIARGTPGFSGADLANLVNEAALLAARRGKRAVAMVEFEDAKDKVLMGPERRSMVMSEDEKALTAWHEAGHAIVAMKTPAADPVHKATIIPRGRALGMVMQLPEDDKYSMSKVQMTSRLAILMGGRAAEEVKFGKDNVTAGASSDIQQATKLARAMVTKWGYSEKVGFVDYSESPNNTFLGQQMGQSNVSEETSQVIESEVKGLVQEGMDTAMHILTEFKDQWSAIAEGLLEYETLTGDEINTLIAGGAIERPDEDSGENGPGSAVPVIGKRKPKGGLGGAGSPKPA
ncbi:MAG: ATP-dependent zinc metalloprotease FtsH [Hyphomonadaceae bacterium]